MSEWIDNLLKLLFYDLFTSIFLFFVSLLMALVHSDKCFISRSGKFDLGLVFIKSTVVYLLN